MSKVVSQTVWAFITISYLSLFCLGLLDNVRGPYFSDVTTDLHLTDAQSSLFFAATSLLSFAGAKVVAALDRFLSRLNILRLGLLVCGAGFYSISQVHTMERMILACAGFGIGFGIINVAQNLLVLDGATENMRRRLFSGLHGMYAVSSLVAPTLAALFFRIHIGWREAFQIFAFAPIAAFLVSLFIPPGRGRSTPVEGRRPPWQIRKKALLFGLIVSSYVLGEVSVTTRLPLYLRRELNFSAEQASLYLAAFFLALLLGRALFTFVRFHRVESPRIIQIALGLSTVACLVGLFYRAEAFVVSGFFMGPVFSVYLDLISQKFGHYSGYAITHVLGLGALYVVSLHLVMGYITQIFDIRWAMGLGIFAMVISFAGIFLLDFYDRLGVAEKN